MGKWVKDSLGNLCSIVKGQQFNKLDLDKTGDYPCVNGGIDPSGYSEKYNRLENTIAISEGGNSCGYVNLIKTKFWSGGHCYSLLNIKERIDKEFLYQALKGREKKIMGLRVGSGLPNIQQKAIREFEFEFPENVLEQVQITKILKTADEAISKTEALIAKYQRLKIGIMQDLLTKGIDEKGNIRNKATHKFVLKNGIEVPYDWEVKTFSQMLNENIIDEIQDGNHGEKHPKSADFVKEGIPFIMASDISNNDIDLEGCKKITKEQYDSLRIGFAKPQDVLLSHKASIGFVAIVPDYLNEIMLTPQVTYYRIKNKQKLYYKYLSCFMSGSGFQRELSNLAKQSTRDYIGILMQRNLSIAYPISIKEQEMISSKIELINSYINCELKSLSKTHLLKTGLMQDLLNGKVRIKVKEHEKINVI